MFYKSKKPELIQAMKDYDAFITQLQADGKAFAELMGAKKGVIRNGIARIDFYGIKFPHGQKPDERLWRKPDENYMQSLRANIKVPPETSKEERTALRATLKELQAKWSANVPKQHWDTDRVFKEMGTNWGQVYICGMSYFFDADSGFVYMSTKDKLPAPAEEILGSEYHLVLEARQKKLTEKKE